MANTLLKEHFFPTTIYTKELKLDNELFEKTTREIMKQYPAGVKFTNIGGWQSKHDIHHRPEFQTLVHEIFKMQLEVYEEEWIVNEPILGNMWINVNPPKGYNRPHLHPDSVFSGTYYVKTPPDCGIFIAHEPRVGVQNMVPRRNIKRMITEDNVPQHLWIDVPVYPKAGKIIMFPSWLWHGVEPNNSNEDRISLSFNFSYIRGYNDEGVLPKYNPIKIKKK